MKTFQAYQNKRKEYYLMFLFIDFLKFVKIIKLNIDTF